MEVEGWRGSWVEGRRLVEAAVKGARRGDKVHISHIHPLHSAPRPPPAPAPALPCPAPAVPFCGRQSSFHPSVIPTFPLSCSPHPGPRFSALIIRTGKGAAGRSLLGFCPLRPSFPVPLCPHGPTHVSTLIPPSALAPHPRPHCHLGHVLLSEKSQSASNPIATEEECAADDAPWGFVSLTPLRPSATRLPGSSPPLPSFWHPSSGRLARVS